jgi:hypothetical protein
MLPAGLGWRGWGLVPLLLVLPLPFWEAMYHQQNTFLSLFLLCVIVSFWRMAQPWSLLPVPGSPRRRVSASLLAGLVTGLLFYKPQLAFAVAAALVLTRGRRALLGLSITGTLLLIFTLREMPGTLTAFLHALPPTIHWMRTQLPYNWGRQVTPLSFWRLLLQGRSIGEIALLPRILSYTTAAGFGVALGAAMLRFLRRRKSGACPDRLIAATIVSMPLIMPYYMDYDLLLFAVPAVLLAGDWIRTAAPPSRADRFLLGSWVALFLEFYMNPGLANHTTLNLAVPLLGILAALSILRSLGADVASAIEPGYDRPTLAVAA